MTPRADADHLAPHPAREALLAWYGATGRQLAFRATADPYAVLVSELMAQQTQVRCRTRRRLDRVVDGTPREEADGR